MTTNRAIANLIELKEALGDKFELKVVNNEELKNSLQFAIEQLDKVEKQEKPKDKWVGVLDETYCINELASQVSHSPIKYCHSCCKSNKFEFFKKKYRYCPLCGEQMIFGDDGSDS